MWANLAPPFDLWGRPSFHEGPLPGEPAGAAFAEIDGVRLHFLDLGEGPPVVFLHGFAASLGIWRTTLPIVASQQRVLALDLKGFGWSGRPPGDYSHEAQAELVWKLLDARGVREASLVGHSWGAAVALAMALRAPARVQRLALYSPFVYQEQLPPFLPFMLAAGLGESLFSLPFGAWTRYRLSLAFHDSRSVPGALVEELGQALARPGAGAAALASLRAMDFAAQQIRYPQIEAPALLLWGREDPVTPPEAAGRLSRDLRGRVALYPGCGHFPMFEAAGDSGRDLARFLAEGR
jgi:pimeloyl-ACP methyl ester carboxylesterase